MEENFSGNSGCESSSHRQQLCYRVSEGSHLSNEAEYQATVKEPLDRRHAKPRRNVGVPSMPWRLVFRRGEPTGRATLHRHGLSAPGSLPVRKTVSTCSRWRGLARCLACLANSQEPPSTSRQRQITNRFLNPVGFVVATGRGQARSSWGVTIMLVEPAADNR